MKPASPFPLPEIEISNVGMIIAQKGLETRLPVGR